MNKDAIETALLGHPRGLATLFFTEMWERFSYYGMRAILLYYMYYSINSGGLGYSKTLALSIMSIYGSLVYLSSVFGGFVSDRVLGSQRTVFYGGIFIMFGHIVLAIPFGHVALFVSIGLITIGTGLLKPNVSQMVGGLYNEKDLRRDTGFSIFVFGINVGAFAAPFIVGYLGQKVNFHVGFSVAAIGMLFGLIQYYQGGKKYFSKDSLYPTDPIDPRDLKVIFKKLILFFIIIILIFTIMNLFNFLTMINVILFITILAVLVPIYYFVVMLNSRKITQVERLRIWAYVPLFIASVLFWSIEEQGAVVLAVFANEQTRLSLFGYEFPSSWFQSMNPLFIMIYVPIFAMIWTKMGTKQPTSSIKFSYGLFFAGMSFLWMIIPILLFGNEVRVSPFWLIVSWALVIIGEMLISPIGLSATTKLAPKAFQSQMMSMWFISDAVAQAFNSQLVRFYSNQNELLYFGVVGISVIAFGLILLLFSPRIKVLMEGIE